MGNGKYSPWEPERLEADSPPPQDAATEVAGLCRQRHGESRHRRLARLEQVRCVLITRSASLSASDFRGESTKRHILRLSPLFRACSLVPETLEERVQNGFQGLRAFHEHAFHTLAVYSQFTNLLSGADVGLAFCRPLASVSRLSLRAGIPRLLASVLSLVVRSQSARESCFSFRREAEL